MKTKIKILIVSCMIATAAITGLNLAQDSIAEMAKADGEINPDCPNGCLANSGWCFCYEIYPFEEKEW